MELAQRPGRAPAPARLVADVVSFNISKAFSPSRGHVPRVRERGRLSRSAAQIAAARAASNATRSSICAFLRGVDTGTRLRVPGEGEAGANGGPSGDLYVVLDVKEHPFFERRGADLYCTIPVSIAQAALGTDLPVPGLNGEERLKIPEGTQSGAVFRIKGHGLPDPRGGGKGDLYYHVRVMTPSKLTREQRKIMEQLGLTIKVDNKPAERGSSFFDKVKDILGRRFRAGLPIAKAIFVNAFDAGRAGTRGRCGASSWQSVAG